MVPEWKRGAGIGPGRGHGSVRGARYSPLIRMRESTAFSAIATRL